MERKELLHLFGFGQASWAPLLMEKEQNYQGHKHLLLEVPGFGHEHLFDLNEEDEPEAFDFLERKTNVRENTRAGTRLMLGGHPRIGPRE